MKAHLYRFFKHYATLLVFTLLVTNCERDPIVETTSNNDTNNALVFEALSETAKQKVKQYNVAVSQTSKTAMARATTAKAKQSFDAKYGRPVFNKTIRLTNHDKNNNVKWIIAKPKTKQFFSSLEKEEVIKYQKHLNKNGYKVNTIGYIDKKTISAHEKYERKKRREKRKAKHKMP
tara:strand:+ start:747 stop:1274 length:528 start_codon:yes stop_codon:yes gene_type:complete